MSEVAIGGGGVSKLETKSEVLDFFFNPSLSNNFLLNFIAVVFKFLFFV